MSSQTALIGLGVAALALFGLSTLGGAGQASIPGLRAADKGPIRKDKVVLTDAQWKAKLTPEQYDVLRHEGTETAFTSPLNKVHTPGTFFCAGCDNPLFVEKDKFDSGTGWPSFVKPMAKDAVWYKVDRSYGVRTEVRCAKCDGHLGHVFDDGPRSRGGLRYCMNGDAMKFVPAKK